jgi:thioredoxin-dependent peroxiredoxin
MNETPPSPSLIHHVVPVFSCQSTRGDIHSKDLFTGSTGLVLYFYPKDKTPGCTDETREFGENLIAFASAGYQILGCSRDSLKSHQSFKEGLDIGFDLISDSDEMLCQLFGVIKMKNMYGKQVRGIERSTFVIDSHGLVNHEWRGVKIKGHVAQVLAALKNSGAR